MGRLENASLASEPVRRTKKSPGDNVIEWIEDFCRISVIVVRGAVSLGCDFDHPPDCFPDCFPVFGFFSIEPLMHDQETEPIPSGLRVI